MLVKETSLLLDLFKVIDEGVNRHGTYIVSRLGFEMYQDKYFENRLVTASEMNRHITNVLEGKEKSFSNYSESTDEVLAKICLQFKLTYSVESTTSNFVFRRLSNG